jgi:hypothetical protein
MREQAQESDAIVSTWRRWSPPATPLVDCFGEQTPREILLLLARVGLGEAWSYSARRKSSAKGSGFG